MQQICYIIGAYHGQEACICPTEEDLVIAADGGYEALEALGVTAQLVVGDFDSLGYVPGEESVIRHPVRKDDTDTLLALRLGLERGYRNFVLVGVLGGRLDHSFANLQALLFLRDHGARGVLYGDGTAVTAITDGSVSLTGQGPFSVFSMDPLAQGVTLDDVSYCLKDGTLTNAFPLGVSNEFTDRPAHIQVQKGTLLLMWQLPKEQLPTVIRQL